MTVNTRKAISETIPKSFNVSKSLYALNEEVSSAPYTTLSRKSVQYGNGVCKIGSSLGDFDPMGARIDRTVYTTSTMMEIDYDPSEDRKLELVSFDFSPSAVMVR